MRRDSFVKAWTFSYHVMQLWLLFKLLVLASLSSTSSARGPEAPPDYCLVEVVRDLSTARWMSRLPISSPQTPGSRKPYYSPHEGGNLGFPLRFY